MIIRTMRRTIAALSATVVMFSGIVQAQELRSSIDIGQQPAPMSDSIAVSAQLRATRVLMMDLRDGRVAGLSRFFDKEFFAIVRPTLDSIAQAVSGRSQEPGGVASRTYGSNNRVSARLFDEGVPILHIEFDYAPDDRVGRPIGMLVMPNQMLMQSLEPVEEPPPTQQMLEEKQDR